MKRILKSLFKIIQKATSDVVEESKRAAVKTPMKIKVEKSRRAAVTYIHEDQGLGVEETSD